MDAEEKMHWVPTAIGMIVLACMYAWIALGVYPGWEFVTKFLHENVKINWNLSANAPVWIQALGSIIALGIAIYVPYKIHNNQIANDKRMKLQVAKSFTPSLWIKIKPLEEYSNMLKYWLNNNGKFSNKSFSCSDNIELLQQIDMVSFEEIMVISQVNADAAGKFAYVSALSNAILFKMKVYVANGKQFPEPAGVEHLSELNNYLLSAISELKSSKH